MKPAVLPRILLAVLISAMAFVAQGAPGTQLKASLDSAWLLMGKATPLKLEVVTDRDNDQGRLMIPAQGDTLCTGVEILELLKADTTTLGNNRIEIRQTVMLQSFDSGLYQLPAIRYIVGPGDTVKSNRLALKVLPVLVDSLATIHDYADVADVDRRFVDYLPDFVVDYGLWILALIVVLAAGGYIYYLVSRRKNPFAPAAPKPVPPYEKAVAELNALHGEHLCQQGREKEFYTRLTDILRQYLQGRFGINAMEMTSTQIRATLEANEQTRMSKSYMDSVLEMADFVKFAKMRPLPDDNERAFASAINFVEETKPAPEPEASDEDEDAEPETPEAEKPKPGN